MNTIQKRFLLFLVGCIGSRSLLAYIAKIVNKTNLMYMGYLALLPAIGFAYLFISDGRKTGPEVFGGKIWWSNVRPVHSILYFLFAYAAITGDTDAWTYLLADVVIGLISFVTFHAYNGDFAKLI